MNYVTIYITHPFYFYIQMRKAVQSHNRYSKMDNCKYDAVSANSILLHKMQALHNTDVAYKSVIIH